MTPDELAAARHILGESDDQLAGTLGVTPAVVRAWSQGTVRIPRRQAQHIAFLAAVKERNLALEASGLPECDWFRAHERAPDNQREFIKWVGFLDRHVKRCPTCQARDEFMTALGPVPPPPTSSPLRVFEWVESMPRIARPAVVGAALLAALVLVRALFSLPSLVKSPDQLIGVGIALLAAASAGAVGGFAYSLTRPTLKRLGRAGDYLSGIVCVFAYMGALGLVAPFAFGEPIFEGGSSWILIAILSVVFGLFIGHSWFATAAANERK